MKTKNKNVAVSWFKLFMAYEVAIGHFNGQSFLTGGLCVNCFFIISGYFLAGSYDSEKYPTTISYTINRIKKLYPEYIVSFILLFILTYLRQLPAGLSEFAGIVTNSLPEIFLLQNMGWYQGGINYPLWFICVLIIASHLLFALLKENRRFTVDFLCPVIALCLGTFYFNMQSSSWGTTAGDFLYVPLCRGLCFISLGIILHEFMPIIMEKLDKFSASFKRGVCLTAFYVSFVIAAAMFIKARNGAVVYLPFIILFLLSFRIQGSGKMICLSGVADRLSLSVFMNQALVIEFLRAAKEHSYLSNSIAENKLVYLAVLTVIAALVGWFVRKGQAVAVRYLKK